MLICVAVVLIILLTDANKFATSLNVSFSQSSYSASESDGVVQPGLVLSNKSLANIIVQVNASNGNATGEYRLIL